MYTENEISSTLPTVSDKLMGQLSRYATNSNVLMPLEKSEFTSQEKRDTEHVP